MPSIASSARTGSAANENRISISRRTRAAKTPRSPSQRRGELANGADKAAAVFRMAALPNKNATQTIGPLRLECGGPPAFDAFLDELRSGKTGNELLNRFIRNAGIPQRRKAHGNGIGQGFLLGIRRPQIQQRRGLL